MTTDTLPYGTWPSPLTIEAATDASPTLSDPLISDVGIIFTRTGAEAISRFAIERDGTVIDFPLFDEFGTELSVGSRVHEYGGPAFTVEGSEVIFSNRGDGRLYRASLLANPGGQATAITADDGWRYCDLTAINGHIIAVAEIFDDTRADGYPRHAIVDINCAELDRNILYAGADFIGGVRLSPSGERIAWFEWDLGQMPWDDTRIMLGERFETSIGEITRIDAGTSSAIFPIFVTDDDLLFIDDLTGWWNIYRAELGKEIRVRALHPAPMEFATPPWVLASPYAVLDEDHVLVTWQAEGRALLGSLAWRTGELEEWQIEADPLGTPACYAGQATLLVGSPTMAPAVVSIKLPQATTRTITTTDTVALTTNWISRPQPVSWQVASVEAAPAHDSYGYFYPPNHPDVVAPSGELPPLIVMAHGGPTSATTATLRNQIQFWTTRGFAVLDVDYSGSSGYGRAYRELLNRQWGVIDNADIAAGVDYLARMGLVDPLRAVIRGGSAGGYAVLRALSSTEIFAAGTSLFGVADLTLLAQETHMFEARYLDSLIGSYPKAEAIYRERSPINHLSTLKAPLLLLQGEEDRVVPPSQALVIHDAMVDAGRRVALRMYPGEAHGFRTASVKQDALATELAFYGEVLGFIPDDCLPKVPWS